MQHFWVDFLLLLGRGWGDFHRKFCFLCSSNAGFCANLFSFARQLFVCYELGYKTLPSSSMLASSVANGISAHLNHVAVKQTNLRASSLVMIMGQMRKRNFLFHLQLSTKSKLRPAVYLDIQNQQNGTPLINIFLNSNEMIRISWLLYSIPLIISWCP